MPVGTWLTGVGTRQRGRGTGWAGIADRAVRAPDRRGVTVSAKEEFKYCDRQKKVLRRVEEGGVTEAGEAMM